MHKGQVKAATWRNDALATARSIGMAVAVVVSLLLGVAVASYARGEVLVGAEASH